ncbi:MAG: FtsX-like permease family protein [Dialister invisus]
MKKALGATNRNIAGEFFGESCMLGFIGGIIGTGCGYLLHLPSESMFLAGVLKFHFPLRL